MQTIDKMKEDGTFDTLSKRERLQIDRQRAKLEINLGSIFFPPFTNGAYADVKFIKLVSAAPNETDNNSGISFRYSEKLIKGHASMLASYAIDGLS